MPISQRLHGFLRGDRRSPAVFALGWALVVGAPPVASAQFKPPAAETADVGLPNQPPDPASAKLPPARIYPEPSEAERRIQSALAKSIDVRWVDVQLSDIVVEIEEKFGIPIELDMSALTADGKGSESLISRSVKGVTLKSLLRSMLDDLGMTYVIRSETLLITTKTAAETYTRTRVYQVHDLVVAADDATARRPNFVALIELISSTIIPETWREAGGTQGEIKEFQGPGLLALIITQTEEGHAQVEDLLAALRAAQVESIRNQQARRPSSLPFSQRPFAYHHGVGNYFRGDPSGAASGDGNLVPPPEPSKAFQKLVAGNTHLACDLYGKLAARKRDKNLLFSPYGVSTAMGLVQLGARGRTADEIASVLHVSGDPTMHEQRYRLNSWFNANRGLRGHRLSSRNQIFTQYDHKFPAAYLGDALQFYDARITPLDFREGTEGAGTRIIEAARRDTEGFLEPSGIAADVTENTKLAVLNTVYFQGRWAEEFDRYGTLRQVFHAPQGDLRVEMMSAVDRMGYGEVGDLQIVRKNYGGAAMIERAAFYAVVPPAEPSALAECEKSLSTETLERWIGSLHERTVELYLPKFAFEDEHDLKSVLQELGIENAFDGAPEHSNADFSGMGDDKTLYLQGVRQKAKIEVNERKTEATAATTAAMGGGFGGGLSPQPDVPPVVRCDRPFLFFIRDEQTGTILFLGRVVVPDNDPNAAISPPHTPRRQQGGGMF